LLILCPRRRTSPSAACAVRIASVMRPRLNIPQLRTKTFFLRAMVHSEDSSGSEQFATSAFDPKQTFSGRQLCANCSRRYGSISRHPRAARLYS
jgi:hypothetical protein